MLLPILAVTAGFALLVWGADRFVTGAAATARNLGVSPMIIGLTIVGFGTSAPEMLVSAMAAWAGNPGLAIGNAVGSNITNIGLILGTTALAAPLTVASVTLRREMPLLLAVMALSWGLLADGELGTVDALVLLAGILLLVAWMVRLGMNSRRSPDPLLAEFSEELPAGLSTPVALAWVGVGLAVLLASSRLLVWGAVELARLLGVSDLVIGLTVVALGTSLPELAASVVSALKGEPDIALGNVIGSNLFNLLGVLGIPGLFGPVAVDPAVLRRDYPVMLALTLALLLMSWNLRGSRRINRIEGALLLLAYGGYQVLLYYGSGK
ncbi:MAG: calcium/sodium antiporter [Gammaproteobacteria bacterium]|nr:MAG: calcium/sodium antiporter [Gammaproteobacteria bacterium]